MWWRVGGLLHLTGDSTDSQGGENDDRMEPNTCGFDGSGGGFAVADVRLRFRETKISEPRTISTGIPTLWGPRSPKLTSEESRQHREDNLPYDVSSGIRIVNTAPWGCSRDRVGMRPGPDSDSERPVVSIWHLEWYGVYASLDSK